MRGGQENSWNIVIAPVKQKATEHTRHSSEPADAALLNPEELERTKTTTIIITTLKQQ